MRYVSTRDSSGEPGRQFCDILLEGLAPDGGLYLPEHYPHVDTETLERWRGVLREDGYAELALQVISLFVDDIPTGDLRGICERAYAPGKFLDPSIAPVSQLSDGLWLLHLSNGPSAAFKDMAMQLLGELFEYELERRDTTITILGATSGDTGSAAEYALMGKPRVRVFMLSPQGRMTPFQQAQMFSIDDPSITNIAVDGVFDDCQDIVKEINSDAAFKARHRIGAVNSINWARLMAQVVYYFAAWLQISDDGRPISFAVPSGNFGNIAAGHVARSMGLPIHRLILATNENNVLDEFFTTGVYRIRGSAETHATSSPSMDISKASNFERYVADLVGRDGTRVAELFGRQLREDGRFDLSELRGFRDQLETHGFVTGSSTHADRLRQISRTYEDDGVLIDPHTADAVQVARSMQVCGTVVALETALPVKFAATITEALGIDVPRPAVFDGIEELPRHVVDVPNSADAVKEKIETAPRGAV
ncbi:MAG: threonine synthase [Propionibacteriaceae bacterium]|nr:threonine synthase [Propionibacteriaceae bacterium]